MMDALAPRYALSAAFAALALAVAGCSGSDPSGARPSRPSTPTGRGASDKSATSTSAAWQSSALPLDAATVWRGPDMISDQTNTDVAGEPGTYTLTMECVGVGTLTLTLTAGAAKPVSAAADCVSGGNAQVTAVMKRSGDVVSSIAVSGRAGGSMVWRLSRT